MKVELISGKGGVGKSVVTAAKARLGSRSGLRTLALSMLPGGGLGPHLGVSPVGAHPETGIDGVAVAEIRRTDALEEYIRLNTPVPGIGMGPAVNLFEALANTAPGVREIITIGKVIQEAESGAWDLVVVDSPPTGQFSSYLRAPKAISELIPAGRIRKQSDRIRAFLQESATITYVCLAEELPVVETLAAMDEEVPCKLDRVILNRMLAPLSVSAPIGRSSLASAAQLQERIVEQQSRWARELADPLQLPFLFGGSDPLLVSNLLTDLLAAAS